MCFRCVCFHFNSILPCGIDIKSVSIKCMYFFCRWKLEGSCGGGGGGGSCIGGGGDGSGSGSGSGSDGGGGGN